MTEGGKVGGRRARFGEGEWGGVEEAREAWRDENSGSISETGRKGGTWNAERRCTERGTKEKGRYWEAGKRRKWRSARVTDRGRSERVRIAPRMSGPSWRPDKRNHRWDMQAACFQPWVVIRFDIGG